jgi:hypothetical protein
MRTQPVRNYIRASQVAEFDEVDLSCINNVAVIVYLYLARKGARARLGGIRDSGALACYKTLALHTLNFACTCTESRYDVRYSMRKGNCLIGLSEPIQFQSCSRHTIPEVLEKVRY